MIKFQKVSKEYEGTQILTELDLAVQEGEFLVLVGPSGSGKTTTLKMINRLIEPSQGEILFDQKKIVDYDKRELRLRIGYVLQQIALFPNLTVAENIELIPEMKLWKKEKRRARTIELLAKVGLSPDKYLHRKPAELSGGEQQRIGILRAIAANPDVILMDEPFSALDPLSKSQLQVLIKEIHKDISSTIIFVTHDMNEALLLGDRICLMKEGKIVQIDTAEEIRKHPANQFVASFFQKEAFDLSNYRIENLAELGLFTQLVKPTSLIDEPLISSKTSLVNVIEQLAEGKRLYVEVNNQAVYEVTPKAIISFLSKKQEGGEASDESFG
ncbi:osmoprotectant transport system ATP-binding protein [Enterococcus sp. AZ194]|uniref:ABC transporter ATP-binding protein n=1 Tax=Enterococcus sp. AZ194 TaxID=2774629 RepID=UPI003F268BB3